MVENEYLNIPNLKATLINIDCSQTARDMAAAKLHILENYNFRCKNCKSTEKLTIHHKTGTFNNYKNKHNNPKCYVLSLCVVLCKGCHEAEHRKTEKIDPVKLEREKEFEEYVFNFKPTDEI